jgi:4-amino-4-deoxy-L-arabinose transferase-like glycosyltransferase
MIVVIHVSRMKGTLSPLRAKALRRTCQRGLLALLHPLTVLLLAFTCNTLLWAAVTNLGNPPDEFSHFDYIRHLAINHTLPIYGETRYIHTQALQAHANSPPLYYLLGTPLHMALSNATVTQQMLALRGLSVLLGAITVALVYMLGRMLAPTRPTFAFAVAALVGFNPMFTHLCAAINSDNLINLIYAALLLLLTYGLRQQQPGRRWLISLGALLGAGLITKQTMVIGVFVSAVVILVLAWRHRPRFLPTLVRCGFWVGSTALLISGWLLVCNWMVYGNPTGVVTGGRPDIFPTHPYRAVGSLWRMIFATRSDFLPFFPTVLRSFWGIFDHLEIWMPPGVYDVMTALLVGGLIGAALWGASSWRHRHGRLTGQRLLVAGVGGLILTFTFAALLYLCYFIDNEPQGRYLFAGLSPLAVAIVGGWEHLGGLLRVRWLVAPLIVALVLTVNVVGLLCALAPAHHDRYLGKLLSDKQVETGEGESYAKDNRYVPKVPLWPEPTLRAVYDASPVQASFVAQQAEIERLEMLLNVPPGARGPLIWRLGQQGITDDLLAAVVRQPLAGPACYRIDVSSCRFTTGEAYTLRLEAPDITARQPLLATLTDEDAADNPSATDVRLQVVYAGIFNKQTLLRADYLLRSDAPSSLRGRAQRLLYPLDALFLLALAAVALAPLMIRPWRMAIALSVLGLTLAALLPAPRASGAFLPTREIAAAIGLQPELSASAPIHAGFHDLADCKLIRGWAWDANQPNTPVNVDIYDGVALVATISANVFRPDLLGAGIGNGYHGFIYAIDDPLKNGQPHSIRVRLAGTNVDLSNTPKSITCGNVAVP